MSADEIPVLSKIIFPGTIALFTGLEKLSAMRVLVGTKVDMEFGVEERRENDGVLSKAFLYIFQSDKGYIAY